MGSAISEGLSLAALLLASGGAAAAPSERPVRLVTVESGGGLALEIVGQSAADIDVSYRLELTGVNSSNRISQASRAALKAGDPPKTLATVRIGDRAVRGDLTVSIGGGASYVEHVTN